eukprot:68341-Chlamydomonas_euryale.AAC.6
MLPGGCGTGGGVRHGWEGCGAVGRGAVQLGGTGGRHIEGGAQRRLAVPLVCVHVYERGGCFRGTWLATRPELAPRHCHILWMYVWTDGWMDEGGVRGRGGH